MRLIHTLNPDYTVTTTWEDTIAPPPDPVPEPVPEPTPEPTPVPALFADNFDYVVGRNDPAARSTFIANGWFDAKTEQSNGGGSYYYTVDQVGGAPIPGANRALCIEILSGTHQSQSDAYLHYNGAVPADVWFQWQIYIEPGSQFDGRNKFLYPCGGIYPCNTNRWLLMMGKWSENPLHAEDNTGGVYYHLASHMVGQIEYSVGEYPGSKLGPYVGMPLIPGQWHTVTTHIDTSTTSGKAEQWIEPVGGTRTKVMEWIDGETANFVWTTTPGGHQSFKMAPTFPGGASAGDLLLDSTFYIANFKMSGDPL